LGLPHAPDAGRSFNDPLLIEKVGRVTVLTAPSDSSRGDKSLILQRNDSVPLLTVFLGETRSAAATPRRRRFLIYSLSSLSLRER
jgi:hypothetical protein